MKCSFHPAADSQDFCSLCNKALCAECAHRVKNKVYCQNCLTEGAEWAASMKNLRLPADAPKRAALCALIPGMGAVYNSEYMKGLTYFAVWAGLVMMGNKVNGVFGFGAFAFIVFTMFDAYRTAEANARKRLEASFASARLPGHDKTSIGWGVFLIILGILFLLQNLIPYYFLNRLWPLIFIAMGAYLVYRAMKEREKRSRDSAGPLAIPKDFGPKEDI
jgi:hypothetical protein